MSISAPATRSCAPLHNRLRDNSVGGLGTLRQHPEIFEPGIGDFIRLGLALLKPLFLCLVVGLSFNETEGDALRSEATGLPFTVPSHISQAPRHALLCGGRASENRAKGRTRAMVWQVHHSPFVAPRPAGTWCMAHYGFPGS